MNIFAEAGTVGNLLSSDTVVELLKGVLGGIMYISIPFIGLALVYSGFMFITARGNTEKVTTAVRNLTYVVVAIALILGSYMFAKIAYQTVIVNILGWAN